MNSRERILAAMKCQPVDRIPFVPNLNGYAIRGLPERFHTMQRWEVLEELGIDLLVRFRVAARVRPPFMLLPPAEGPATLASSAGRAWADSQPVTDKIKVATTKQGRTEYVIVDTPLGQLRCGWVYTAASPDLPFPSEYLLKTIDDVRTYRTVLDHTVVEPAYEEIIETLEAVGDAGTCEATGYWTPMQDLIEILLGVENFYYFMTDHPAEMEALMVHMQEVRKEQYRVLADSPAPIIITGENTSTTLASPSYMARWEFPALNEYSDIVHRTGKIHVAHMCGRLHRVVDLLEASHLDGLHDVAPAPTGDFDFRGDLERLRAAGKSVAGGIDATAFVGLDPEGLEAYLVERLAEAAPGTGFLMRSGDTVPLGTTEENLRQVMRTLQRYGKYPLQ